MQSSDNIQRHARTLVDMPPEIIHCVVDHLSLSSSCSFSLCNKRTKDILGPRCWARLRQDINDSRIKFLKALARDQPALFACTECIKLHPTTKVIHPSLLPFRQPLACVRKAGTYLLNEAYATFLLRFVDVQLAMDNHRFGPRFGMPLSAFDYTEFRIHKNPLVRSLISVEARVSDDELLVRTQRLVLRPQHQRWQFLDDRSTLERLCRHIWMYDTPPYDDEMTQAVREQLEGGVSRVSRCTQCQMDFLIEILDFGVKGSVMSTTRWLDFGKGLNPSDSSWECHLPAPWDTYTSTAALGSIKARFERQAGVSHNECSTRSMEYMFWRPDLNQRTLDREGVPGFTRRQGSLNKESLWVRSSSLASNEQDKRGFVDVLSGGIQDLYQALRRYI